jgi:hypothetical protein
MESEGENNERRKSANTFLSSQQGRARVLGWGFG